MSHHVYESKCGVSLGALGVGLLVGATIGLLLAPQPGRETREGLKRKYNQVSERIRCLRGDGADETIPAGEGR